MELSDTALLDRAIEMALRAHRSQVRKGTGIPFVTHPLAVGIILARTGCPVQVIAAGILHDTVEDTEMSLADLRETVGHTVAQIVEGASEPDKTLSWEERKAHTIEHLRMAPLEVRLVSAADKLHNLQTISLDYETLGEGVWQRFNRGKAQQAWYYGSLVKSLCRRPDNGPYESLFESLKDQVEELFGPGSGKDRRKGQTEE